VLLACLVSGCATGDHDDDDHDHVFDTSTALLVSSRHQLRVCLQPDSALAADAASLAARLTADLEWLARFHPVWRVAGLDIGAADVAVGCPGSSAIEEPIATVRPHLGRGGVDLPSPFRLYVYAMEESHANRVLGSETAARAPAELARQGDHVIAEVSTAVIARAAALGTPAMRELTLPDALGLPALSPQPDEP